MTNSVFWLQTPSDKFGFQPSVSKPQRQEIELQQSPYKSLSDAEFTSIKNSKKINFSQLYKVAADQDENVFAVEKAMKDKGYKVDTSSKDLDEYIKSFPDYISRNLRKAAGVPVGFASALQPFTGAPLTQASSAIFWTAEPMKGSEIRRAILGREAESPQARAGLEAGAITAGLVPEVGLTALGALGGVLGRTAWWAAGGVAGSVVYDIAKEQEISIEQALLAGGISAAAPGLGLLGRLATKIPGVEKAMSVASTYVGGISDRFASTLPSVEVLPSRTRGGARGLIETIKTAPKIVTEGGQKYLVDKFGKTPAPKVSQIGDNLLQALSPTKSDIGKVGSETFKKDGIDALDAVITYEEKFGEGINPWKATFAGTLQSLDDAMKYTRQQNEAAGRGIRIKNWLTNLSENFKQLKTNFEWLTLESPTLKIIDDQLQTIDNFIKQGGADFNKIQKNITALNRIYKQFQKGNVDFDPVAVLHISKARRNLLDDSVEQLLGSRVSEKARAIYGKMRSIRDPLQAQALREEKMMPEWVSSQIFGALGTLEGISVVGKLAAWDVRGAAIDAGQALFLKNTKIQPKIQQQQKLFREALSKAKKISNGKILDGTYIPPQTTTAIVPVWPKATPITPEGVVQQRGVAAPTPTQRQVIETARRGAIKQPQDFNQAGTAVRQEVEGVFDIKKTPTPEEEISDTIIRQLSEWKSSNPSSVAPIEVVWNGIDEASASFYWRWGWFKWFYNDLMQDAFSKLKEIDYMEIADGNVVDAVREMEYDYIDLLKEMDSLQDEIKEKVFAYLRKTREFDEDVVLGNLRTGGQGTKAILNAAGYDIVLDAESEKFRFFLEKIPPIGEERIDDILSYMGVADYRHTETDYDDAIRSVKWLSEEQKKSFRRSFN